MLMGVMSGRRLGSGTSVDPDWANTVALLQPPAGASSYSTDAKGKAITIAGTVPLAAGGGFTFSNNSANYLTMADAADWELGATFTVEAIVTLAATGANFQIIGQWGGAGQSFRLGIGTASVLASIITTASQYTTPTPGSFTQISGTPTHVAMVLTGGVLTAYYQGSAVSSVSSIAGTLSNPSNSIRIGVLEDGNIWPFNGTIHGIRVTKNVARYTAAFTPPASFPTM